MLKLLITFSLFSTILTNNLFANDLNLLCGDNWQFKIKNPNKYNQTEVFIKYDNTIDLAKSKLISSNADVFVFDSHEFYHSSCYTEISVRFHLDRNKGTLRKEILSLNENTIMPKQSLIDDWMKDDIYKDFKDKVPEMAKDFCKPSLGYIAVRKGNNRDIEKTFQFGTTATLKYFETLKTSTCKTLSKKF